ncbi:MAG TPA: hypothetical protein V6D03_00735, partial [Candidatus Caenarcaniphilales bacterium]
TLLSAEPLAIVLPKGLQYEELRRKVNDAIVRWRAEGWLKARITHWRLPVHQPLRGSSTQFDRLEEVH